VQQSQQTLHYALQKYSSDHLFDGSSVNQKKSWTGHTTTCLLCRSNKIMFKRIRSLPSACFLL